MAKQPPVTAAIDLGYGQTKFTRRVQVDSSIGIEYEVFPSIALGVDARRYELEAKDRTDVKRVRYGDEDFVVGPDIIQRLASEGDYGRNLSDNYYDSPVYHALMRGALSYMGETSIDVLCLGLPVSHFRAPEKPEALKKAYTGVVDLDGTNKITIKKVLVHAQPMGGFFGLERQVDGINAVIEAHPASGLRPLTTWDDLLDLTVLVVDPGEFTLDWLLVNKGSFNPDVSGAAGDAGRHRVLNTVKEHLEARLQRRIAPSNLQRLNDALRSGTPFKLDGRVVDLSDEDLHRAMRRAVENPMSILMTGIKGARDVIDLVLMVGGHPELYAEAFRKELPHMPIFIAQHPLYSNVEGLQIMAEEIARRDVTEARNHLVAV